MEPDEIVEEHIPTRLATLHNKIVERDLTIRFLIAKMDHINKQLKHCMEIKDKDSIIFAVIKELERLDEQMESEYKRLHNTALSTINRSKKMGEEQ